jgi:hypothetical protein
MIYCIWYPSAGFGHFINSLLTLRGNNFVRPPTEDFLFSEAGDSHELQVTSPKYNSDLVPYKWNFLYHHNHSVLVDYGIIYEEHQGFKKRFPDSKIIKICYNDHTWPILAQRLSIIKELNVTLNQLVGINSDDDDWFKREKIFLFLKNHGARSRWRPSKDCVNLQVEDIQYLPKLISTVSQAGIVLDDISDLHQGWWNANQQYFQSVQIAQQVVDCVNNNTDMRLDNITDLWCQGVIYYYLWLTYHQEPPHNDWQHWLQNTQQINQWLAQQ